MLLDNISLDIMALDGGTVTVSFKYSHVLNWKLKDYFDEKTMKDIWYGVEHGNTTKGKEFFKELFGRELKGFDFLKSFTIKTFWKELDKFIKDNSHGLKLITRGEYPFSDDWTSGAHYWVFPKGSKEEDIIPFLVTFFGITPEGYGTGCDFDCSGREFKDPVYICLSNSGKTVVASQSWALDI